ncbi:FmdB family zinc ribbon protein [Salisaeta longa]|uniref:FmdB family zinc ribbon protein n=1 Tax=Salisaeta longa TaxID=503170 RepID=UPI0003B5D121|nr:FmdB family zinc ribbon protein [Salisaeta longa]
MPTYVYRREDGTTFEIQQRITADPLEKCPETGQPVERIISGQAGLIFKGDGFYVNDYGSKSQPAKNNGNGAANGSSSAGEGRAASDASSNGATEAA